jgi:hypothetical protein
VELEKAGVATVSLISRSFCSLAQIVARGQGFLPLPIAPLPHPVGDADPKRVREKGTNVADEVIRLLLAQREKLEEEFSGKRFPLPEHVVSKR